jgi:hypothetical protein
LLARQQKLTYYHCQRKEVSEYRADKDRGSNQILEPVLVVQNQEYLKKAVFEVLEEVKKEGDFRVNSKAVLCQNRMQ